MMKEEAPRSVPEWVVTYGDMMSLLLTFFIMLVSMSEVVADKRYRAVLESLQQYVGYRSAPSAPPGTSFPLNSMLERLDALMLGSFTSRDPGRGGVRTNSSPGTDARVFNRRDGIGVLLGEPVSFRDDLPLDDGEFGRRMDGLAELVRGKPNKIAVRGIFMSTPGAPRDEALQFRRLQQVMSALIDRGIQPDRFRLNLTSQPVAQSDPIAGRLTVEIRALDVFWDEFIGVRDHGHEMP